MDREGIFRVSCSARVIERLKTLYETNDGDVEFDDKEDIVAIAGLMKLFLRELPDSIIPTDVVRQFLQVQTGKLSFHSFNICIFVCVFMMAWVLRALSLLCKWLVTVLLTLCHNC